MRTARNRASLIGIVLATVFITGCGNGLSDVTGKVTLDGKAVPGLEVRFEPKDPGIGTTAIGYTKPDGTYQLHYPGDQIGAPAGEYEVRISGGETDPLPNQPPLRVAPKYNARSELTATVTPGVNTLNFDVTSK